MNPSRWLRLQGAFGKVIERNRASRADAVAGLCESDPSLQSELLRLVQACRTDDPVLDWANGAAPAKEEHVPVFESGELLAGRFRIIRFLGRGGMGEVYQARDEVLGEDRALKTVSAHVRAQPEAERRFIREVALAQLVTHPNVCRIHDIFNHTAVDPRTGAERKIQFLSMELLGGETLADYLARRGTIPPEEALPWLRGIAEALEAAHRVGVIHRDLKPGNIFLTGSVTRGDLHPGLHPVVTDFGLASLAQRTAEAELDGDSTLQKYTLGGTPGYAAPELLEGGKVTPAADMFALGAVTLEMVCGRLRGVANGGLPEDWQGPVERCLNADPFARPSSPAEFIRALEGKAGEKVESEGVLSRRRLLIGSGVAVGSVAIGLGVRSLLTKPRISSITVLPFEDRTGGTARSGFTEELIRTLITSRRLRVVAPYSASTYQRPFHYPAIAAKLKCQAFLTGAISARDIEVKLVRSDGSTMWNRRFGIAGKSSFGLDKEIQTAILGQIDSSAADALESSSFEPSGEGYRAYLAGRALSERGVDAETQQAERLFREAIAHDADYAHAWAELANTLQFREKFSQAQSAVARALELDSTSAEAYIARALVRQRYEWNWAGAEADFRKALDLEPFSARAHHAYGGFLSDLGRNAPALLELKTGVALDPLSIMASCALGICQFYARQPNDAISQLGSTIELAKSLGSKSPGAYVFTGACWAQKGNREKAFWFQQRAIQADPLDPELKAHFVVALARFGELRQAAARLDELLRSPGSQERNAFYLALACANVGHIDQAFRLLEKGVARRDGDMTLLKVHPYADTLRDDPRYRSLIQQMNL